jgi:hypothetical protein
MTKSGQCPICKEWFGELTKHHVWRRAVWGRGSDNNEIILICEGCHATLEQEITRREGIVLREHPEIYQNTLQEFLSGEHDNLIAKMNRFSLGEKDTRQDKKLKIKIVIRNYNGRKKQ